MQKGFVYEKASPKERIFYVNKIPNRYWKIQKKDVIFSDFTQTENGKKKIVKANTQIEEFTSILSDIQTHNGTGNLAGKVACVSSSPTEDMSMSIAFYLATSTVEQFPVIDLNVIDLGHFRYIDTNAKLPHMVVIHNIMLDSPWDRIEKARDCIKYYSEHAFVILATAGCDPVTFMNQKLKVPVDYCFYSHGQITGKILSY